MKLIVSDVLAGKKAIALAITNPNAALIAILKHSQQPEEISNGTWADFFVVAARVGGPGFTTLLLLEHDVGVLGHTSTKWFASRPVKCQGVGGS
ncbi:hypothetical protein BJ742DRAFT_804211 [Cladochytrium replicatum]|nr:hypothetical protein BJ742DRAFT_804211 [Cladochytrium replicatum]